MLNIEERVAIVSAQLRGFSYQQVKQSFERKFRKPDPRANIRLLVNKCKRTGSVLGEKRSGGPQTSEDDLGRIQQTIRRLSDQLDIPKTTVWTVLHFKLKERTYHLQVRGDYRNNNFRNTWIGRAALKHWASHSPDLTPLDFLGSSTSIDTQHAS
jgi:hypothetical protein